jgi:hypothetical protein
VAHGPQFRRSGFKNCLRQDLCAEALHHMRVVDLDGAPLSGAIVLTWWLAPMPSSSARVLIALAFRLKAGKDEGPSIGTAQPA